MNPNMSFQRKLESSVVLLALVLALLPACALIVRASPMFGSAVVMP